MSRLTSPYRATWLLQVVILLAAAAGFLVLLAHVEGPPLPLALVVLVAWLMAVELEVLPTLLEWWILRWARRHTPPEGSPWFVDGEAEEGREAPSGRA